MTNTVTVNGQVAYRNQEYFRAQVAANNTNSPLWTNVLVSGGQSVSGNMYLPQTPEAFQYDADGNLTNDGRWQYIWDGENRLVQMIVNTNVGPQYTLNFAYDPNGRRIQKVSSTNGVTFTTLNFLYDGWNLVAGLSSTLTPVNTFMWGSDLSGTMQGAGGVGGLLETSYSGGSTTTNCFPAFDGNGNVMGLVNSVDGTVIAEYDYGPFGEVIRSTGPMAKANPFRFSTKYQDDESDLLYYGYRYYKPSTGTWVSRDPAQEDGGDNLYAFVGDDAINHGDISGLGPIPNTDYFSITFEPHHYYTKVWLSFHSGRDSCGNLHCKSPKLAQIAVDFGGSLGHWINPFGLSGQWFLDTKKRTKPWYPYQNTFNGYVEMTDAPGTDWYHFADLIYPFYQYFETCAVCTDGGPTNYKILGCANWGHHIAGIGGSTQWGDGQFIRPVPPSSDFTRLFTEGLWGH